MITARWIAALALASPPPSLVHGQSDYDRHVFFDHSLTPKRYFHRSLDGGRFRPIGIQRAGLHRYADFLGAHGREARYRVTASGRDYRESPPSETAAAATRPLSDDEMLTMVQEASFRYYWEGAHPVAGMALENVPGDDRIVATGASGFGILAILVGIERGFWGDRQSAARVRGVRRRW